MKKKKESTLADKITREWSHFHCSNLGRVVATAES
jgi:hypothetical protein